MLRRDRFGNHISVIGDYPKSPLPIANQRMPSNIVMPYQRPRQWVEPYDISRLPAVASGTGASSTERGVLAQRRQRIRPQQKPIPKYIPKSMPTGRGRPEGLIRILLRR